MNMRRKFEHILAAAAEHRVPEGLEERVLSFIEQTEKRRSRVWFIAYSVSSVLCIGGIIPAFAYMTQSFMGSAFYTYFSLLFSDPGVVAASWQEFAFLIAESTPVWGMVFFFGCLATLLLSLRAAVRAMRTAGTIALHGLRT